MRKQTKSFNSNNFTRFYFVVLVLLIPFQICFADTTESNFNLLILPASADSTQVAKNFSGKNFCNCGAEKLAPRMAQRVVNTDKLDSHKGEKEFKYERTVKDEASSFWRSFWEWLQRKLFGKINRENANKVKNIVYWLIAIFAVIIVGFWLYKSEFFGKPLRSTTKIKEGLFEETERSQEDIDLRISNALKQKDYPLAIRWLYIKGIKTLSANGQIEIRQDKTNYDYYLELKNGDLQKPFYQLTRLFEFTNYGDFTTTLEHYTEAEELFKNINRK